MNRNTTDTGRRYGRKEEVEGDQQEVQEEEEGQEVQEVQEGQEVQGEEERYVPR